MGKLYIELDKVKNLGDDLKRKSLSVSDIENNYKSLKPKIDSRIRSRRDIGSRLNETYTSLTEVDMCIKNITDFVKNSAELYSNTEKSLIKLADEIKEWNGENSTNISGDPKIIDHGPVKIDEETLSPEKKSFWESLKDGANTLIDDVEKIDSVIDDITMGGFHLGDDWDKIKAVAIDAQNAKSIIAKELEPGGNLYVPMQYIKSGTRILVDCTIIAGSGVLEVFSGGTATPAAVLVAGYAANDIINAGSDAINVYKGDYDKVGKVNLGKSAMEKIVNIDGKIAGESIKQTNKLVDSGLDVLSSNLSDGNANKINKFKSNLDSGLNIVSSSLEDKRYTDKVADVIYDVGDLTAGAKGLTGTGSINKKGEMITGDIENVISSLDKFKKSATLAHTSNGSVTAVLGDAYKLRKNANLVKLDVNQINQAEDDLESIYAGSEGTK